MKPPPGAGSIAIVLVFHSQWPVLSGVLPETSQAHGRESRTTWLQDMGVHKHCRQLRGSGWRQDRAEPRTGCLPSVTVLSQRYRNCLMPCAAPEQQESAVSNSKTIFQIRESAAAWLTFQFALKSPLEKEGRELCLEQNFHENLQLSLF